MTMIIRKLVCKFKGHALEGGIQTVDDLIKLSGLPGEYVIAQCGRCGQKFKYYWIWSGPQREFRKNPRLFRQKID